MNKLAFTIGNIISWLTEQDDTVLVKLWNEMCYILSPRCLSPRSDLIMSMPSTRGKLLDKLVCYFGSEEAFDIVSDTAAYTDDIEMHFSCSDSWFMIRHGMMVSFNDARAHIDFKGLANAIYDYHGDLEGDFDTVDDYFDFEDEEE